jgi:hypothetical protein
MAILHVLVQAVLLFVGQSTACGKCLTQLRRDHCRMVDEFTTISAYHHKSRELEPR